MWEVVILCISISCVTRGSSGGASGKESPANAADLNPGLMPGSGGPLEEEMETHSNILAWDIPCTEEPDRL